MHNNKYEVSSENSNSQIISADDQQLSQYQMNDLLEPQYYPDPVLFRKSLEKITKDDQELKENLASNKATLRVLAPYLKIIHKDQKRIMESARVRSSPKVKESKFCFDKKSKEQLIGIVPDILERFEMILSIQETADVLKTLVRATTVVSYLVNPIKNELYQSPRNVVSSTSALSWKIEPWTTMAAFAAYTKQYTTSDNVLIDSRFPLGLGYPGSVVKYAMCVPIKTPDNNVIAVYELSREAFEVAFDQRDLQLVITVTSWMGVAIRQNNLYLSTERQQEIHNYLIQLTNHYHSGLATVDKTLSDIVMFARQTVRAERCNLYIVDKESKGSIVVDEYDQGPVTSKTMFRRRTKKQIELNGSVLSKVMQKKEVVNEQYNILESKLDVENQVRSILGVPIIFKNIVLGAILLTNKRSLSRFDKEDEVILRMFASYCTVNINHLKLQDSFKKIELQNNINQEMLCHHITPCIHDQETIKKHKHELPENFYSFAWYPSPNHLPKLAELTINMFQKVLGDSFMELNDVPKFILTVRNCYRPNSYHNFLHAFVVTHTMANIISRYHGIFSGLERKALMIACLCHDVDHRGYTNNFVHLTKHYLSQLYETSPLENHHFAVAKMIIEQCGMFKYLKTDIYNQLLTDIYELILATDLTLYFQNRIELMKIANDKTFTFTNIYHRRLVKSVIMMACDLSGQTKPFPFCKKITEDFYEEFFELGDIQRRMGFETLPSMDRTKRDMIAENQVQFLRVVVFPCIEIVTSIFRSVSQMAWNTNILLNQWKELIESKDQETWKPEESWASVLAYDNINHG